MTYADVVIVGAGAAGLSLAYRLCAPDAPVPLSVLLVDAPPGPLRPPPRTWCFWEEPDGEFDAALSASWERLRVRAPDGTATVAVPAPLRYKMLRSDAFAALVGAGLDAATGFRRAEMTVRTVRDAGGGGGEVVGEDARGRRTVVRGRYVFDSRPPRRLPAARTTLLQHFTGWFVHTERPVFDADTADLMDFRTPQPRHGLSFAYVLPLDARSALVEYTEFSREPLEPAAYEQALDHHLGEVLGASPYRVSATEHGVIPMTDGRFPPRAGRSVFRIGTAGGATRPSTGYTFGAVQRQSRSLAAALREGKRPPVHPAYRARSLAMDAVMLRALDTGRVDGAGFFTGLFRSVPAARLLRFLDGSAPLREELLVGLRTPVVPMLRTVAELPFRARRPAPEAPVSSPSPPPPARRGMTTP
ncbi:lycopene cyclase family protein [Streptomyces sp. NBC_00102]|uniref:lycopene cyclase family protein n=1 Tax=Streptomyces sp. NBC_00102 TaxID=2975652 RepID=UPI00225572D3|nr:lycopene cyclase family protein [Streptomyces sp. NBC_00102]MCX5401263.1 lycopene cyclase family protein [Streptomyces sp. NBC_00102]